jgi:hypothetical protein
MNLGVYSVFRKEFTTGVKCTALPLPKLRGWTQRYIQTTVPDSERPIGLFTLGPIDILYVTKKSSMLLTIYSWTVHTMHIRAFIYGTVWYCHAHAPNVNRSFTCNPVQ